MSGNAIGDACKPGSRGGGRSADAVVVDGVFCLAAALVILRTRVLPVWIGWIGIVAAVMGVIAVFFLVADDPGSPLGTPANAGGFLLSNLFFLLVSAAMLFRVRSRRRC